MEQDSAILEKVPTNHLEGLRMEYPCLNGLKIGQACQDVIRVGPTIYDCKDGLNNAAPLR